MFIRKKGKDSKKKVEIKRIKFQIHYLLMRVSSKRLTRRTHSWGYSPVNQMFFVKAKTQRSPVTDL